jgi:Fe-S-cluster containining protein
LDLVAQAVKFECQPGCTECCRQQGFVYLTEADLERIAAYTGMSTAEFERRFIYRTRNLLRLRVPKGARCQFLTETGCSIHPVKPVQCRAFPFWPELVESRREWLKAARYCPGMGRGPLVQIETAQDRAREMREAYPSMY